LVGLRSTDTTAAYFFSQPLKLHLRVESSTGNNNRIWFYSSDQGLILVDHGDIQVVSEIPEKLYPPKIGGVYIFNDGRIWVGSTGVIWEFVSDQWRKIIIPDSDELFLFFAEASNGVFYGATDTSVYKFDDYWFSRSQFVYQDKKPAIVSDDGGFGDCSFHKNYIIASNCSRGWSAQGFHYRVLYLNVQDDGSVVYINNRIIAKLENEEWKSFLFDTYPIYSGTVDGKGYFWLFTTEGIIRLAPESFNSYQGISY
jgi:ligand-binding sensor domain-containing protein